jgi:23S rRNA (pseudouridine1915-N3)-methyltransferase
MKISVLCVGKIKEKFFRDAVQEYVKRLGAFTQVEIIEVPDRKIPDKASPAQALQVKGQEGKELEKHLDERAYKIALCLEGKKMDSIAFSQKIQDAMVSGYNHIQFLIGGSLGLSPQVVQQCDFKLSFSDFTFPHQLMRVILFEQVYRAFKIATGEPYHK